MKTFRIISILVSLALIWGCSDDESPVSQEETPPPGSVFSGITERNEWGDTLSVDSTDWVIVGGGVMNSSVGEVTLPRFRDGKRLIGRDLTVPADQLYYSIGAFPNPFIPGTGRLLIEFILPELAMVELRAEDEAGTMNTVLINGFLDLGIYQYPWPGKDEAGENLPEGFYRIFFRAGSISSFGDVQVQLSGFPEPPPDAEYVLYAEENYAVSEYADFEYWVAANFGWDGEPGGDDVFSLPNSTWELMDYMNRFQYLPVFMNYDISSVDLYQYHYLLAYKHFQFGAGWPDDGDSGTVDPADPQWQLTNIYHDAYIEHFEQGP